MVVQFEKEVCEYLGIPSIPKKEWDGESGFKNGVAVVSTYSGGEAYAVATFNPDNEYEPRVKKVFSTEPFEETLQIFVVPEYMDTDLRNADLDAESKKRAEEIVNEADEDAETSIEMETATEEDGVKDVDAGKNDNPYLFDFIHNDEEARAYIAAYNKKLKTTGKVPTKHETILMRLEVIYNEVNKTKTQQE